MNAAVSLLGKVLPSVVHLSARVPGTHVSANLLGTERMGSGVLVDSAGLILTVNYVVVGASSLTVRFLDGREFPAELVKHDFDSGLALVRVPATDLPALPLVSSQTLELGADTFIIASAGPDEARVADGWVSFLGAFDANWEYMLDRCIMTTAMNPGLGGGPVIDNEGNAVGIVSLNMNEIGRFSMAVPSEYFSERRAQFLNGGGQAMGGRAWLGVFCYAIDGQLIIAGVMPGAPGDRAGLQPGDVVVSVDDMPLEERRTLYRHLAARKPGENVRVALRREGRHENVQVTAGNVVDYFA